MTTPGGPAGLLLWGQGGRMLAVDDREVITALAGGRTGLLTVPQVGPAPSGLGVTVEGGWWAVVHCGDGTCAVVGSRSQLTVDETAGGPAARTDYLWCDVDPEAAEWQLVLLPVSATANRPGILLARITVPAGTSSAAGMSFHPEPARLPLAKGVLAAVTFADPNINRRATSFSGALGAATIMPTPMCQLDDGRWYRLRWRTPDAALTDGTVTAASAYIEIRFVTSATSSGGWQAAGPQHTMAMRTGLNWRTSVTAEHVFTGMSGSWRFAMRPWVAAGWAGGFALDRDQRGMLLTLEDLGPGPDPVTGGED